MGLQKLLPFLAPPAFPDALESRRAALVHTTAAGSAVLCALMLAGNLLGGHTPLSVPAVNGLMVCLALVEILLVRRRSVQAAALILVGSSWAATTAVVVFLGTIRAPATSLYILIVLVSSILFEKRGLAVALVLSSAAVGILAAAEHFGYLRKPDHTITITQWITFTGAFGFGAYLIHYTLSGMAEAMARSRAELLERQRSDQLSEIRSRLLEYSLSHDVQDVLRFVLDEAEVLTGSRIGFFHFCEGNDLTLQMWSTRTMREYCHAKDFESHYPMEKAGIWADCVRDRKPVVCNNYAAYPGKRGMPEGHAHLARFISVPVIRGDRVVAVIGVGNRGSDYTELEVNLLSRLADLSWEVVVTRREQAWGREKLRTALEYLPLPIIVADAAGVIFFVNREFTRLYGYSVEDIADVETWFHKAYPDPAYREEVVRYWTDAVRAAVQSGSATPPQIYRIRCKDGAVRSVEITGRPAGEILIGSIVDVTEKLKAQEERDALEERLHQADKLESLGVLAGGIAHDFNNLLGGVFGFLELAKAAYPDAKTPEYLERAVTTIDRARDLTRQLLTFSRGGAPARVTQSIAPVVREAAQFALSGSNVSLALEMPEGLWLCDFDKNQIAQVADNLVINACQAMRDGGTLMITAANEVLEIPNRAGLPAGRYVRVSFQDTGPGIELEDLPRVFDPFFTTKKKGHGLGLATAHSIMRRHDGAIIAESHPGAGSTFHIFLREAQGTRPPVHVNEPDVRGSGARVLVMDDEDFIREIACEMLREIGYESSAARDGEEALRMLQAALEAGKPFAVVIMDLTIPGGMGGREAVRYLPGSGKTLALVSSGYSEDPVMANPKAFGFAAKLEKPFRKAELARVIGRVLAGT